MNEVAERQSVTAVDQRTTARIGARQALVWLGLLVLIVFPLISPNPFYVSFGTEILIYAIWAVSLDLLVGYTGLVSFGHAAYFGLGAYAGALVMMRVVRDPFAGILGGLAFAALAALLLGHVSVRLPGIAFSMLTLAFAQMFYTIAFKWRDFTGGDDGLRSVPRPSFSLGPLTVDAMDRSHLYWLTLLIMIVVAVFLRRVVRSPFGAVLQAIRENEERARFVGYDTHAYKFRAFVIAGAMAGVSGSLFALLKGFLAPNVLHWGLSGEVLMMAILGGLGTLFGPMLGAGVFMVTKEVLTTYTEHWQLILGPLFVIMVLLAPGGIVGMARKWLRRGEA